MGARSFAQINSSLLNSKKLRQCNHVEKWAYICAHLTSLGSYTGQFEYPLVLWSRDAHTDDIEASLTRLTDIGLIEYDFDDEFVRIAGFLRQRPPENASRVVSLIADLSPSSPLTGLRSDMLMSGIAELSVGAIQRAQNWKAESQEWPKLRNALKPFLGGVWQEYGDAFGERLVRELETANTATKNELTAIFPPLLQFQQDTVSAPSPHPAATRDVDETIRIRDENEKKTKTKTTQLCEIENSQTSVQTESSDVLRKGTKATVETLNSPMARAARRVGS